MPRSLEIQVQEEPGVVVICPQGRIDSSQVEYLEQEFTDRVNAGQQNMVVDFAGTLFLASSVLRVLLVCRKRIGPTGGRLVVCNLKPHIRDLFRVAGFDKLLKVVDSREKALVLAMPPNLSATRPTPAASRAKPVAGAAGTSRRARTVRQPTIESPPASLAGRLWRGFTAPWRMLWGFFGLLRGVDAKH